MASFLQIQFTHPAWLWLAVPALAWTLWLVLRSDASLSPWRLWASGVLRVGLVMLLILALAGLQWKRPQEGMNVFFVLDRSDSVPAAQQEAARELANRWSKAKKEQDKAGFLIFGSEAALETSATEVAQAEKIQAVVGSERTDIAGAIRLATAAFPENGQKKIVLFSDGNENIGDAYSALLAARPLGVMLDVHPLGVRRGGDVSVQKLGLPSNIKKGQTFDAKIFATSDRAQPATVRLYRNDQLLGQQKVQLEAGKNLFTFPQTLTDAGFYGYQVQVDVAGDTLAQNNKASSFTHVRGDPRILVVSSEPDQDRSLVQALKEAKLDVRLVDPRGFPSTLGELQSYDSLFLSNVAAGDLGLDFMRLLQSAVRDFGIGLVCLGGDQAYAAGAYRNTPLEETLPLDMELSSKKVLPTGALVLVMHGMEFNNGNQVAREIALASLDALGPQDEMGVLLWDGADRWLFELQKVAKKQALAREIAGMNQGDLPSFQNLMEMGHAGLKRSSANIKHMIVFSDGDPNAPTDALLKSMVGDRITVSTVMIGGHVQPTTMIRMAELGKGRFYDVKSAAQLPQIFIKEAAVILKSAIFEETFKPQVVSVTEPIRGIGPAEYPVLRGYVATTPKPRAEIPMVSEKGDPILAHWQYGLGRAVAFTSDARAKWADAWMGWPRYRQFWAQLANWTLRRVDTAHFNTEVSVENGEGVISVEALDTEGNFRNFLNLETIVTSPKGESRKVLLQQTGPGHYEARFPTRDVGAYLLNLMEMKDGKLVGSQVLGASVNYSPEFNSTEPNENLLQRLSELGDGRVLAEQDNPFLLGRKKTFQPKDLWDTLLKWLVVLFVLDVGLRRVDIDREEWERFFTRIRIRLGFGDARKAVETQEALGALLARKERVRESQTAAGASAPPAGQRAPESLFSPRQDPPPRPDAAPASASTQAGEARPSSEPEAAGGPQPPTSTASRLLEAKRRAGRKT